MFKKKDINIIKSKYKIIYLYRYKIKFLILKSIFINRNLKNKLRVYAYLLLNNTKVINKKYHKICKFNGFRKNVNKFTGLGRHELNRLSILGKMQNISVNS
jgi:hypothetical protein